MPSTTADDTKKKTDTTEDEHEVDFERALQLTGKGSFHVTIALACGFSFLAAGFQNSLNAYILPSVRCDLRITSSEMGLLNAVFLAGGISSNFMWGILSDMLGRKTVVVSGMLLDALLTFLSSFSQHFYVLLVFRYLNGFVIGGPSSIVLAYMSEFFPEKLRSKVICYVGTFWTVSWLILPAVAWFIIPIKWSYNSHGILYNSWRILVFLVSLPSLISGFILMLYPESPRFILAKGRNQEARDILAKVYSWNTRNSPDKYPVKSIRYEGKVPFKSDSNETKSVWRPLALMVKQCQGLFAPHTLKITFMWCTLFFCNMFGYYGLGLWLPELFNRFEKHYQHYPETTVTLCQVRNTYNLENNSTLGQSEQICDSTAVDQKVFMKAVIIGFVGLLGNIISGVFAGRLHRRTMPVVLMMLSGICVIVVYFLSSPTYNLIMTAGFQLFIGTANLVYNSLVVDVFPPSVSGMGVCLGILTGRLGAMISNLVFGHLIDISCSIPIFLVAGVCIVSSFWNHGAPFSQLMFMSTMVGEDKDTICPQVQEGTPEYFADQTNLISNPEHLTELYSKHPPPTTTKNAKEFFKTLIPNGEHQFQPALDQDIGDRCMNIKPCDPSVIFRTLTGECNNARFPMWGVTDVNLVPLVPAHYEDNNDKIRVSKSGKPLINARKLHRKLISDQPKESTTISYAFMIWSQLISHDTARIMDQRPATGPTCLCCTNDGQMIPEDQRAAVCQPIEIPADDPFYSKHNVHCLNFVRSLTTNEMDCIIEPDQKLGDVSHYLDCSVVYGSTPKKCNSLREFNGGRLRAEIVNGREYMPPVEHPEKGCFKSPTCFDAGDDRCNQNNQLAVMHLMLFRLHNLSCKELLKLNPHWDDEKTFQVARIIVISLFQHITYEESLPILLGREFAVMQNLSGITTLRDDLYQQFLNPGTLVEYTSATDRLLHTLVPSKVKLYNKEGQVTEEHKLSDTFHNPHRLKDSKKLTQLLYGMVYQPSNEINTGVTPELTNLMFKCDQPYGFDLLAMDIDRAREHGVTTYKNLRVACGLSEIKTFADLIGIMSPENIEKLKSLYEVVDDVDAFIGMYMEFKIPGSLTGPVMQCIMTEQFKRWQLGDIYYYAFSNSNNPLSESQFQQIRNSSLSMLFCMCGDNIEQMPKNSFLLVGPGNEMVPCSQIPKISFDPWKESS